MAVAMEAGRTGFVSSRGDDCGADHVKCVIVGLALTAIASVACYFCLAHGVPMLDHAMYSNSAKFLSYALIYGGATFSLVAVGNVLFTAGKILCQDDGEELGYGVKEMKWQIAGSILAPIAAVPILIFGAAAATLNK